MSKSLVEVALLKKSTVIHASPEKVFSYVNEPSTLPQWLTSMVEVRNVIGTGEGQQYEWTYKMAGLLLRGQSIVVELIPYKRTVHQSIGTIGSTWTLAVEPHSEGATLTAEIEYDVPVSVLGKLAERFALSRDARDLEASLANAKEILEV